MLNDKQKNQVIISVKKCIKQMEETALLLEIMNLNEQSYELYQTARLLEEWIGAINE